MGGEIDLERSLGLSVVANPKKPVLRMTLSHCDLPDCDSVYISYINMWHHFVENL